MPTLRNLILDGRWAAAAHLSPNMQQRCRSQIELLRQVLRSHEVKLVNASPAACSLIDVLRDAGAAGLLEGSRIPCPRPPFHFTWLETIYPDGTVFAGSHAGALVTWRSTAAEAEREKCIQDWLIGEFVGDPQQESIESLRRDRAALAVSALFSAGVVPGEAAYLGQYTYWLDAEACYPLRGFLATPLASEGRTLTAEEEGEFLVLRLWLLQTFMRLNCHNVELVPARSGIPKSNGRSGKHPPSSVWHEIVVKGMSQLRRQAGEPSTPEGEKREVRFHAVRGHLADYTKGKGLFGKWKVRLWVDEHTAGNPDLGTVRSTYRVEE
jgi:hypothetical protein